MSWSDPNRFFFQGADGRTKTRRQQIADEPEEVALYAVRALDKNRAIIIPGRRNRWLAVLPRLGSRWLVRTIAGMVNKAYCPH